MKTNAIDWWSVAGHVVVAAVGIVIIAVLALALKEQPGRNDKPKTPNESKPTTNWVGVEYIKP